MPTAAPKQGTEGRHNLAAGLDALALEEAASILASAQADASRAVGPACGAIADASALMANSISGGGRLIYAGAGSSGLMAMADALELPGTFGIAADRIVTLIAGGLASFNGLPGGYEDDRELARADLEKAGVGPADCVIVATASGSTPYAVEIAERAAMAGASVIAMANNADAVLFEHATAVILLETPPEILAGSTRMGAGTAQKIAFNMLSTLTGIRLGHVHDGYMVNLRADNAKLRNRASRIVAAIAGIAENEAQAWLDRAGGNVKAAILMARGDIDLDEAKRLLDRCNQNLRSALLALEHC